MNAIKIAKMPEVIGCEGKVLNATQPKTTDGCGIGIELLRCSEETQEC